MGNHSPGMGNRAIGRSQIDKGISPTMPRLSGAPDNSGTSIYLSGLPFPTGRGFAVTAAALLLLAAGVVNRSYLALGIGTILTSALVASAYASWDLLRQVTVERDINLRGQVGKLVPFRIELVRQGKTAGFVVAKDQNFGVHPVLLTTDEDRCRAVWLLRLTQRGFWNHFRTMISTSAPAGLFIAKKEVVTPADVVIGPATLPVEIPDDFASVWWAGEVRARPPRAGVGVDFLNIREYRPGDRLRRIHWRAFARHDEIFVREMEHEGRLELLIAVETLCPPLSWVSSDSARYPSLEEFWRTTPALPSVGLGDFWGEQALTVAASLAVAAVEEGHTVHLISGSQPLFRARSREDVLDYFARTRFGPDVPTVPKLKLAPARASQVLVTSPHSREFLASVDTKVTLVFQEMPSVVPENAYLAVVDRKVSLVRLRDTWQTSRSLGALAFSSVGS
jgi:uncharacterized protein (DUF58 family)